MCVPVHGDRQSYGDSVLTVLFRNGSAHFNIELVQLPPTNIYISFKSCKFIEAIREKLAGSLYAIEWIFFLACKCAHAMESCLLCISCYLSQFNQDLELPDFLLGFF